MLFNGKDLTGWASDNDSGPAKWVVQNGYLQVVPGKGGIHTTRAFGDVQLHPRVVAAHPAAWGEPGRSGNSGVFLMSRYEIQVLDIYHNITYADGEASAVCGQYAAARPDPARAPARAVADV